ncbi:uncharacterized protein LOC130622774 [Hydractinia symbiolongicarpus]|uniref:uncharacterized protein LOC130622774 n=1 Tax=Hydractinia symbiolongicarpus TaxID=13093 RepID=UPI002550347F|nr:uncharacterized protein LOC130622774 [Hydractinia symbiolongicarpus]
MTGIDKEQDGPHQALSQMVKGSLMLKAGRMGRPHFRQFQITSDLKTLQWESPNKLKSETCVAIHHITELQHGQKTKVFEDNPIPEYEAISFSVLYKQANVQRSLDIVCKDRTEYDTWTVGLQALLDGFDDIDGVKNIVDAVTEESNKLSLEFGLIGDRLSMKQEECDIYTWGASPKGTLGHGEETEELVPRVVEALLGRDVRQVACGTEHTLAVTGTGEIFGWGSGRGGKLGMNNIQDRYMPLQIGALLEKQVVSIACSELHSAVVTSTGELFTFGRAGPRLGYTIKDRKQSVPLKVEALSDQNIIKVACGLEFTIALTSDGKLFSFGENGSGQLGLGHYESCVQPTLIESLKDVKISQISCGSEHAGAVTADGDVWLWGSNNKGQLGTGDTEARNLPHEAPSTFWNEEIQDIKCGGEHTVVLSCTGLLYAFGDGQYGQLGINLRQDAPYLSTPCNVPLPTSEKVVRFDCGVAHTAAVIESGLLYTWGRGAGGRLGHADHKDRPMPALVESLAYKTVEGITCGADHTAACVIRAWVHDQETKNCMACKVRFTAVKRRHHCRKCGGVFCGSCTSMKFPILEMGFSDPVRVCDRCYNMLSESKS